MADWPDHRGTGGRMFMESVAECSWKTQQAQLSLKNNCIDPFVTHEI